MEKLLRCHLCKIEKPLRDSHIIPRSYFKRVKSGSNGQAISVTIDGKSGPKKQNANPTEKLLCEGCEGFLNRTYEKYGTRLLISRKNSVSYRSSLSIKSFQSERAYLYFISILWRASISTLAEYKNIFFSETINECLRTAIYYKTTKLKGGVELWNIIRVCLLKVVDRSGTYSPETLRRIMMGLNREIDKEGGRYFVDYFMVDGYLIGYIFEAAEESSQDRRVYPGQIVNGRRLRIPKVDVSELKQLIEGFNYVADLREKFGSLK